MAFFVNKKRASPRFYKIYNYILAKRLIHLAHANTRFPEANLTHWRFGYFLTLLVGLYFPLNLTRVTDIPDFFPQIVQIFSDIF